jgi:hypothetical protein
MAEHERRLAEMKRAEERMRARGPRHFSKSSSTRRRERSNDARRSGGSSTKPSGRVRRTSRSSASPKK